MAKKSGSISWKAILSPCESPCSLFKIIETISIVIFEKTSKIKDFQ
jgi:hypothetical protein